MSELQLLTSPIVGPLLPSPSVLTGTFRPQTAAVYLEQSLAEARARLATPSGAHAIGPNEACKTCSSERTRQAPSPGLARPTAAPPSPRPPQLAVGSSPSGQQPDHEAEHLAPDERAPTTTTTRSSPLTLPAPVRPGTTPSRGGGTPGVTYTATSAAVARLAAAAPEGSSHGKATPPHSDGHYAHQPHDHVVTLPSLHAPQACESPKLPHTDAAASGPRSEGPAGGDDARAAPFTPQTPPALASPTNRRASHWSPASSSQDLASRRAIAGSAPTASASEGLEPLPSRPRGVAAAPGSKPVTPRLRQSAPAALVPTGLGGPGGRSGWESLSHGVLKVGGPAAFHHTATKRAQLTAGGATAAALEASRPGKLRVSRGMVFSVFQELDEFDAGRITYSAFEQAACKIGMRPPQARRLFEQLDPWGRGYTTMREWSSPQMKRQMDAFTRLYVQATRGQDGRPKDVALIRSVPMAVQMAMLKLQLKRCGRAVSLDRLVQAFAYMDTDKNGALSAEEVEDALNALGIFVTPEVIDTIMHTFDKDHNGNVNYYEFVRSIYPTLEQAAYRR